MLNPKDAYALGELPPRSAGPVRNVIFDGGRSTAFKTAETMLALILPILLSRTYAHNGSNVSTHDCAKRPGLPPDFPALYEELNNGSYSERLYGARHKLPRCSQLRLLWLPLMDNATLKTIHLCGSMGMVPRPVPPRLLYFPFTYEYKDSAMVPALLGNAPELRNPPLEPWGIPSNAWVEVTHCPVGACVEINQ